MAPRWSNPSGSVGIQRFRVWPAGEDKYNHIELAQNWEKVDALIGVAPDGSIWPPTTGANGGLWAQINTLKSGILPIGMMMAWVKNTPSQPLPVGFAICDGSTLNSTQHDFPGGGNITLPDLRNRFIIGADATKPIGQAGVAITHSDINNPNGAPGPSGVGGSNTATLSIAQLPSHNHEGQGWTGYSSLELVWYNDNEVVAHPKAGNFEKVTLGNSGQPCHGQGGWSGAQHRHKLEDLAVEGSNAVHDNRPQYVGIIWIMKVKNIG